MIEPKGPVNPKDPVYRLLWSEDLKAVDGEIARLAALCQVRLDLSRPAEAREPCERAVALRPDSATLHQQLGLVLEALGAGSAAIEQFRRALALEPGAPVAERALRRLQGLGDSHY